MNIETALSELRAAADMLAAEHPDLAADERAWIDTLSGLTSGVDLAEYLAERALHLVALQAAAVERARTLQARAKRLEAEEERLRSIVLALVDAAGGKKLVLAGMTLSARNTPAKLQEINAAATPTEYLRTVTTIVPDKPRIKEALDLGAQVDGWAKSNGGRALSIHTR